MRVLWAPWRLSYIESSEPAPGCIFCDKPSADGDSARKRELLLSVSEHSSTMMNRYPYANGHIMVAPRIHTADFAALSADVAADLQSGLQRAVEALRRTYNPRGFNIGMNLGVAGGAGIDDHLHWHVVPRWEGDTNFMPMIGDVRVMPEHLDATYDRLKAAFDEIA